MILFFNACTYLSWGKSNHFPTGLEKGTHCEVFQEKSEQYLIWEWSNAGTGCQEKLWDVYLWKYSKLYCIQLKAICFNCSAQKMHLQTKWPLEVTSKLHDSAILGTIFIPVTFLCDKIKMTKSYPSIPWIVPVLHLAVLYILKTYS